MDSSESVLRTSLPPGLLKAIRFNADRQMSDVRLFEIGHVFGLPTGGNLLPDEREDLAAIVAGERAGARLAARTWAVLADALRLDNVAVEATFGDFVQVEQALTAAGGLVEHEFRIQRIANAQLEPRAAIGAYDPATNSYLMIAGSQGVVRQRATLAAALGPIYGRNGADQEHVGDSSHEC